MEVEANKKGEKKRVFFCNYPRGGRLLNRDSPTPNSQTNWWFPRRRRVDSCVGTDGRSASGDEKWAEMILLSPLFSLFSPTFFGVRSLLLLILLFSSAEACDISKLNFIFSPLPSPHSHTSMWTEVLLLLLFFLISRPGERGSSSGIEVFFE